MSSKIKEDLLKNGTIPLMTEEGIKKVVNIFLKVYSAEKFSDVSVSRILKLDNFKRAENNHSLKIEGLPTNQRDTTIYIYKCLLEKIKQQLKNNKEEFEKLLKNGKILNCRGTNFNMNDVEELLNFDVSLISNLTIAQLETLTGVPKLVKSIISYLTPVESDFIRHNLPYEYITKLSYDYRIYLNAPNGEIKWIFYSIFAKKCIERNIPFDAKPNNKDSDNEVDRAVLYTYEEYLEDFLEILEEIKKEYPELTELYGTPISAGINYSYYAVCHNAQGSYTYNDWISIIMENSFIYSIIKEILENEEFLNTLSEEEKQILKEALSEDKIKEVFPKYNKGYPPVRLRTSKIFKDLVSNPKTYNNFIEIIRRYVSEYIKLEYSEEDINRICASLEENIKKITSLCNFGDEEHLDSPICFRDSFYENKDEAEDKPLIRTKVEKSTERNIKEEGLYEVCPAPTKELAIKAIKAMCGNNFSNEAFLYSNKVKYSTKKLTREEQEELIIKFVGIDLIVEVYEELKEKERGKTIFIFENSLQKLRGIRGKKIGDKIIRLKDKDAIDSYLNTLSKTEKTDAYAYLKQKNALSKLTDIETYIT